MIYPQDQFPLLKEYAKIFPITEKTIFAYDNKIYCNYPLDPDILVHEQTHLEQQNKIGLDKWVFNYLHNPKERLKYEKEAYIHQILSVKNREIKNKIRLESSKNLSSSLYGSICTFKEAWGALKY